MSKLESVWHCRCSSKYLYVEVMAHDFKPLREKRDKRSFAGCRYLLLANFSFEMEFWTNLWTVNLEYITIHNLQSTNWSKLHLKAEIKKKNFFYCIFMVYH